MSDQLTENLKKLPEYCYGTYLVTGETVILKKGESGYRPCANQRPADELNAEIGVTKAEAAAMEMGSLMGFHVPGADPDVYDEEGKPKRKSAPRPDPTLKPHHLLVASVIRDVVTPCRDEVSVSEPFATAAKVIAECLANAFHEEDPSFDPEGFMKACKPSETRHG